jgi:hypothetical protein
MTFETYSWRGPCRWTGTDPQSATSEAEVASNLDVWYAAGKPIFTKESIRKVQERIDSDLKVGDHISVVGLDGVNVEFDVETGNTHCWPGQQWEYAV